MRLDIAKTAAFLLERIEDLEKIISQFEQLKESKFFEISNVSNIPKIGVELNIKFKEGKLSTEIFKQNILVYAIDNFNVELSEVREELEKLK